MSEPCHIWCGPGTLPQRLRAGDSRTLTLSTVGAHSNVHLSVENISKKLAKPIPSLVHDMLEVGSYVYAADQSFRRGGETLRGDGIDWRRDFVFHIPVRNVDLWKSREVSKALVETLSFLSDETFEFRFRPLGRSYSEPGYFNFDEGRPWFDADEVLLFSGGVDSLAGLCQTTLREGKRVILVSHRAAPQISSRQTDLLEEFKDVTEDRHKVLHVPVWVNKGENLTRDVNQRCRSFLFVMLASAVAEMHGHSAVNFYENGITSCNLSVLEQLKGARASRTTHPRVLKDYSRFLSLVLDRPFTVKNPLFWNTKTDVFNLLRDMKTMELIRYSNSCSHVRTSDPIKTHCGTCSQCVDRRFAALASQGTGCDPEEMYKILLLLEGLPDAEARTMAESFVQLAREVSKMSADNFYQRFGAALDIVSHLDLPTSTAANRLFELYSRHAQQVNGVVCDQVREHADTIARGNLVPNSLLAMVIGVGASCTPKRQPPATFPTPPGAKWGDVSIEMMTLESARIRVGDKVSIYTGYDMGFRDHRKGNALNKQWDLLWNFAESEGKLDWANEQAELGNYKAVHDLNQTLKAFFGIKGNPIRAYERGVGYLTRFKLTAKTCSRH